MKIEEIVSGLKNEPPLILKQFREYSEAPDTHVELPEEILSFFQYIFHPQSIQFDALAVSDFYSVLFLLEQVDTKGAEQLVCLLQGRLKEPCAADVSETDYRVSRAWIALVIELLQSSFPESKVDAETQEVIVQCYHDFERRNQFIAAFLVEILIDFCLSQTPHSKKNELVTLFKKVMAHMPLTTAATFMLRLEAETDHPSLRFLIQCPEFLTQLKKRRDLTQLIICCLSAQQRKNPQRVVSICFESLLRSVFCNALDSFGFLSFLFEVYKNTRDIFSEQIIRFLLEAKSHISEEVLKKFIEFALRIYDPWMIIACLLRQLIQEVPLLAFDYQELKKSIQPESSQETDQKNQMFSILYRLFMRFRGPDIIPSYRTFLKTYLTQSLLTEAGLKNFKLCVETLWGGFSPDYPIDLTLNQLEFMEEIFNEAINENKLELVLAFFKTMPVEYIAFLLKWMANKNLFNDVFCFVLRKTKTISRDKTDLDGLYYKPDFVEKISGALKKFKDYKDLPFNPKEISTEYCKTLLVYLVLVSREDNPSQDKESWIQLGLKYIGCILTKVDNNDFSRQLIDILQSVDCSSFLPELPYRQFTETVNLGWRITPEQEQALITLFSPATQATQEATPRKHRKKKHAAQSTPEEALRQPPCTETPGPFLPEPEKLDDLSVIPRAINFQEASVSSGASVTNEDLNLEENGNDILFKRAVQRAGNDILKVIARMQTIINVPDAFQEMMGRVAQVVLQWTGGEQSVVEPQNRNYELLDHDEKKKISFEWNTALAAFLWELKARQRKHEVTQPWIEQVVTECSAYYFQDITASFSFNTILIQWIRELERTLLAKGCKLILKGSLFLNPDDVDADYDLLILSENIMSKDKAIALLFEIFPQGANLASYSCGSVEVVCMAASLTLGDQQTIEVDISFLYAPLSLEQELNFTVFYRLNACAIHWHVNDGHAVLLLQSARHLFAPRPVLLCLSESPEDLAKNAGYILKNLVKYEHYRLSQPLKDFYDNNVSVRDRIADPEHKTILSEALRYVLDRFQKRSQKVADYILRERLLRPFLEERAYHQCSDYFKAHFMPLSQRVSGALFLAMFLYGAHYQATVERRLGLVQAFSPCMSQGVMRQLQCLLASLPDNPLAFLTPPTREATAPSPINTIFSLWHTAKQTPPATVPGASPDLPGLNTA